MKCPHGYKMTGAVGSEICDRCESGKYCRGGVAAGPCIAGYQCVNDVANLISLPNPSNLQCDLNKWCPQETVPTSNDPIDCLAGTFNSNKGGKSIQDCFPCEPGYMCTTTAVTPCPLGKYCTEYVSGSTQSEIECPIYTYSSVEKLFLLEMCQTCPAGYNCNKTGISDYETNHKCQKGHYCVANSDTSPEKKCPKGTYLNAEEANKVSDCKQCPKGFYCD